MLPRHLLGASLEGGQTERAWGLRTPPAEIAGLGPFRLKEFVPGQRVVLERNPYYWKTDAGGTQLPYLNELVFTFSAGEDMQVMRFQAGESDVINRIAPKDYAVLQRDSARRGYALQDAGPVARIQLPVLQSERFREPEARPGGRLAFRQGGFRRHRSRRDRPACVPRLRRSAGERRRGGQQGVDSTRFRGRFVRWSAPGSC